MDKDTLEFPLWINDEVAKAINDAVIEFQQKPEVESNGLKAEKEESKT